MTRLTVLLAAALVFGCQPAMAKCGKRADLLKEIEGDAKEKRVGIGLSFNGLMWELFVNETAATWSLITTRPDGLACTKDNGRNWEAIKDKGPVT